MIFDLFRNEKVKLCRIYYLNFKILFISMPFYTYESYILSAADIFIGSFFLSTSQYSASVLPVALSKIIQLRAVSMRFLQKKKQKQKTMNYSHQNY